MDKYVLRGVYSAGVSLVAVRASGSAKTCAAGNRLRPVLRNGGRAGGLHSDWVNWILQTSDRDTVRERERERPPPPASRLPFTLTLEV